jgi:hypothetical protein
MRLYLAGPMRGIPFFNIPAFHAAAAFLRDEGHTVFSPAEDAEYKFGPELAQHGNGDERALANTLGITSQAFRRRVFTDNCWWLCTVADGIALLPGWEKSKGAAAEKALAEALGLHVKYIVGDVGGAALLGTDRFTFAARRHA